MSLVDSLGDDGPGDMQRYRFRDILDYPEDAHKLVARCRPVVALKSAGMARQ